MVKDIDVTVNVYQPGEFESPIHEGLTRLSYFLVILSVSITDTPAAEAKEIFTTA